MATDDVTIRKARHDDVPAIKVLADANRHALGFVLRSALVAGVRAECVLVAEAQAVGVVGFVHYRHRRDDQTTMYQLCVDSAFRGNGVGRRLVCALAAQARELGKVRIRAKSPSDSPSGAFYEAFGFVLVGREPGKKRDLNVWEYLLG